MASESDSSTEGSPEEGEGEAAAPAPSVASTSTGRLRVVFDLRKARKCLLCNCSSTDQSPLDYGDEIQQEHEGRIPWRSYEKVKTPEGDTVQVPSGKLDRICFNVFRALGSWKCLVRVCFPPLYCSVFYPSNHK